VSRDCITRFSWINFSRFHNVRFHGTLRYLKFSRTFDQLKIIDFSSLLSPLLLVLPRDASCKDPSIGQQILWLDFIVTDGVLMRGRTNHNLSIYHCHDRYSFAREREKCITTIGGCRNSSTAICSETGDRPAATPPRRAAPALARARRKWLYL